MRRYTLPLAAALARGIGVPTAAAIVEAGPGGFNDGWVINIYYQDDAARGTDNDRNDPTNALGATNGARRHPGLQDHQGRRLATLALERIAVTPDAYGKICVSYAM